MLASSTSLITEDSIPPTKPTDSKVKPRRKRKYSFQDEAPGKRRRFNWSEAAHTEFTANVFDIGLMNATPQKVLPIMEKLSSSKLNEEMILKNLREYAKFRLQCRYTQIGKGSIYDKNAKKRLATQREIIDKIQKLMDSDFIEEETVQNSKNDLQFLVWKRQISKSPNKQGDSGSCSDNESSDLASSMSELRNSDNISPATSRPPEAFISESATAFTTDVSEVIAEPRRVHFYRPVDDVMSYQGRVIQFGLKIPYVDALGRTSIKEVSIRNYYHASLASLVIAASSPDTAQPFSS